MVRAAGAATSAARSDPASSRQQSNGSSLFMEVPRNRRGSGRNSQNIRENSRRSEHHDRRQISPVTGMPHVDRIVKGDCMIDPDAMIVGAGPAGLACAATLSQRGLKSVILEKADTIGAVWRRHYERLHLHTDRGHSGLPGLPMPRSYPRYPSRAQVVAYLESYAAQFDLHPVFHSKVEH